MIDVAGGSPSIGADSIDSFEWLFAEQVGAVDARGPPLHQAFHGSSSGDRPSPESPGRAGQSRNRPPPDSRRDANPRRLPDRFSRARRAVIAALRGSRRLRFRPSSAPARISPVESVLLTVQNPITRGRRGFQGTKFKGSSAAEVWGSCILRTHFALDRIVALKLLQEGRQSEPDHRARFKREAAAVAKCQHPNLVQIYEIGEYADQSYLALEYVEGGTLANSLAGVPQPPLAAATLVEILARAIEHAHTRGVVHRDLKPANVLLTADRQPKITDFGLAKIDETTTRTEVGSIMGTLAYMAPEQALGGTTKVGPRTDIHAFGAVLYEALTGRPPFRAESPELVYHQLVHSEVVRPSRIQTGIPRPGSRLSEMPREVAGNALCDGA